MRTVHLNTDNRIQDKAWTVEYRSDNALCVPLAYEPLHVSILGRSMSVKAEMNDADFGFVLISAEQPKRDQSHGEQTGGAQRRMT